MRKTVAVLGWCAMVAGAAFAQEIPIVGGDGVSFRDLVGSDTLVSVVLKDREAVDPNLRIVEAGPDYFRVAPSDEEATSYQFSDVKEIRVQDDVVEIKKYVLIQNRALTAEQRAVLNRAYERAREIYQSSNDIQYLKMHAAILLALNEDKAAHDYLRRLAASNDLLTEVTAVTCLFLIGDEDPGGSVLARGLQSGDLKLRAKAIALAGLLRDTSSERQLLRFVKDRSDTISAPAARALARLNCRAAIPELMEMVTARNEEKGEAAVYALSQLGGSDVIEQVNALLDSAEGLVRYRLALVLYNLGHPEGKRLLTNEIMQVSTLKPEAAVVLARDGVWDGVDYLADRLKRLYDEKDDVMLYRAEACVALIQGGDPTAVSHLQKLLSSDKSTVKRGICKMLAQLGDRKLIVMVSPTIENADIKIATHACTAAIAMASPDFRERLTEFYH